MSNINQCAGKTAGIIVVILMILAVVMAVCVATSQRRSVEPSNKQTSTQATKSTVNQRESAEVKHVYTGSCAVKGVYRKRYASCTGDYSPQAKTNAENKAYECNINSKAVQGCYNTYK